MSRIHRCAVGLAALLLLAACGGGGSAIYERVDDCSDSARKTALRDYFNEWYFWYGISPRPDPNGPATVSGYFSSLLYTGGNASFPADRWSYFDTTANFNQFYGEGRALGYGLFVTGLEVEGRPDLPLYLRYVEPLSPAGLAGAVRGDRILSINGRSAASIIAANDYSVLSPASAGVNLQIELDGPVGHRTLTLQSASYELRPVTRAQMVTTPQGREVGYLHVKDMISQALAPAGDAMAHFRAAGASELVLDLRYNGGGLVTVSRDIASLVAGPRASGRTYASLLYNDKRAAANNTSYQFTNPPQALGLARVYILAGERTCSASEQLAIGLRPFVNVVLVGDASCGKPVGFLPHDDRCGTTYSVVNFESVNASNEGRYFSGLRPTCAVNEDWTKPLGATDEPLLATALAHADGQACTAPALSTRARPLAVRPGGPLNDGERPAMIPR
ncbi:peptidase S41 [Aquincola sp. S2]|uniref:Peptidase S41 n=1 Tax=Pseudaquabacterium terrae TaxID=2732868 RepID=A0ABX2EHK6_9BURK|nr:S41 family peptidase [Aquabacterium terrae]NRF68066.1 peptidase S41 [Aquabacterium terrae]